MLNNYFKIIQDGIEVTECFDLLLINQNILLSKECVSRKETTMFSSFSDMIRDQMVYVYSFIYKDEYYILVLDEVILPDLSDEWEGHYWYITPFDIKYIEKCSNKRVFRFDWTWFLKEENSDEFSQNEMDKINPIIRKHKISKILNDSRI